MARRGRSDGCRAAIIGRRHEHRRGARPAAQEFPDVTISKIRFLESEGLVQPARTPSGYRQFTAADVERLRFVLAAQRDHYLPLKVIKEQLDAADRGATDRRPASSAALG